MIVLLCVFLAGWAAANAAVGTILSEKGGKEYLVEINRISRDLSDGEKVASYDLSSYHYIKRLSYLPADVPSGQMDAYFSGSSSLSGMNYLVKPLFSGEIIKGYVRYEYTASSIAAYRYVFVIINAVFAAAFISGIWFFLYIKTRILQPFNDVQDLPLELSKGRLKKGLKENRNRFFGRFIWGLDLLRESIETQKRKELTLEKEKKTLILSISHGIKTPLCAIMLYSKALYDNLYDSQEKRAETARAIEENARQIERLVAEIVQSQTEDILDIEVIIDEFYLEDLVEKLQSTYSEKLALIRTEFVISPYSNLLLKGDQQRLLDVFENLIENAVKYGDGRRISLFFEREDNCQLVLVENTGTPIPPIERMHVFESFWRGSNAHNKPGNGLGLYICKHITGKMNGDVFIKKTEDGMCFAVVIPAA